jgi:hypothetical protein
MVCTVARGGGLLTGRTLGKQTSTSIHHLCFGDQDFLRSTSQACCSFPSCQIQSSGSEFSNHARGLALAAACHNLWRNLPAKLHLTSTVHAKEPQIFSHFYDPDRREKDRKRRDGTGNDQVEKAYNRYCKIIGQTTDCTWAKEGCEEHCAKKASFG